MTQASPGATGHAEPHGGGMAARLNWLRAAVLGSQQDSERAMLALERCELAENPEAEVAELTGIYRAKGLAPGLARHAGDHARSGPGPGARDIHRRAGRADRDRGGERVARLGAASACDAAHVLGGAVAMGVTYGIGSLIGAAGIYPQAGDPVELTLIVAGMLAATAGLAVVVAYALRVAAAHRHELAAAGMPAAARSPVRRLPAGCKPLAARIRSRVAPG